RGTVVSAIHNASRAWDEAPAQAKAFAAEMTRRLEACDLFLRWVASGQISAFALTEPSAGSDTARVATRAVARSVPLKPVGNGTYTFEPYGMDSSRILLDARRLVFQGIQAFYRYGDSGEAAKICFDEYDYETDDPQKQRYIEVAGARIHFTDIAQ